MKILIYLQLLGLVSSYIRYNKLFNSRFTIFYKEKKSKSINKSNIKKSTINNISNNNNNNSLNNYNFQWQKQSPELLVSELNRLVSLPNTKNVTIEQGSLNVLLSNHLPNMNHHLLANMISYIGILKQRSQLSINHKQVNEIMKYIHLYYNSFNHIEISILLVGLSRLYVTWDSFVQRNNNIIYHIENQLIHMDNKQIGDITWAIASMGGQWRQLSKQFKYNLLSTIDKYWNEYDNFSFASIIWSLAKLGVHWNDFADKQLIISKLLSLRDKLSPQQSSKLLWALGSLGCLYSELSTEFIDYSLMNINKIKRSQVANTVSSGQTLTGLAKLGLSWHRISKDTIKSNIWEQVIRVSVIPNDKALANIVWALGTIDAPANEMPNQVRDSMLDNINRIMNQCSSWTFCNIIWGLAKMSFEWPDFNNTLQESITMNIARLGPSMNNIDITILIWSLGELDTCMDKFPTYVLDSLYTSILTCIDIMKPEELSRLIWGLSSCGMSWDKLPTAIKWNINVALRRVSTYMIPQDIANSAYGLALLSFDTLNPYDAALRGSHETLLNTIENRISTKIKVESNIERQSNNEIMENEQLRIFSHYLFAFRIVTDLTRIPTSLLSLPIETNNSNNNIISNLQKELANDLRQSLEIKYEIISEYSSFQGVFPVDIAIMKNNMLIALIEVDGPHHFRYDGSIRRKDKLKELMYTRMNPDILFHRIRWDEVNKFGSLLIAEEVATMIIKHSKNINYISSTIKSIEREFSSFFSWSLRKDQTNDYK